MILQSKSGVQEKIKGEFEITEHHSDESGQRVEKWEGATVETESTPLVDEGAGKPIILRTFEFELPPHIPKRERPTKEQLLDFHKSKVVAFLWKDELELVQDLKIVPLKNKKAGFRIFATCQAKKGSNILIKPQRLQDVTAKRHTG